MNLQELTGLPPPMWGIIDGYHQFNKDELAKLASDIQHGISSQRTGDIMVLWLSYKLDQLLKSAEADNGLFAANLIKKERIIHFTDGQLNTVFSQTLKMNAIDFRRLAETLLNENLYTVNKDPPFTRNYIFSQNNPIALEVEILHRAYELFGRARLITIDVARQYVQSPNAMKALHASLWSTHCLEMLFDTSPEVTLNGNRSFLNDAIVPAMTSSASLRKVNLNNMLIDSSNIEALAKTNKRVDISRSKVISPLQERKINTIACVLGLCGSIGAAALIAAFIGFTTLVGLTISVFSILGGFIFVPLLFLLVARVIIVCTNFITKQIWQRRLNPP